MKHLTLYNKILFIFLCLGAFIPIYFVFPQLRIVCFAILAIFISLFFSRHKKMNKNSFIVISFFFLYVCYTLLISLFNIQSISLKEIGGTLFILLFIISALWLFDSSPSDCMKIFYWACIINLIFSVVISIVEMTTGWHFPNSNMLLSEKIYLIKEDSKIYPTGLFFNTNDFSIVTTFCGCYILSYRKLIIEKQKHWGDIIFWILCFLVIGLTRCRTALFAFMLFTFFYQRNFVIKHKYFFSILSIIGLIAMVLFVCFFMDSSTFIRGNLYKYSFLSLFDSYCLGYGIRGDAFYYTQLDNFDLFHHIIDSHSFLFHFLLTSGILFFISYIILLVYIMKKIKLKNGRNEFWFMIPLYILLLFAPSTSNYLWIQYLFFCSIVAYLSIPKIEQKKLLI